MEKYKIQHLAPSHSRHIIGYDKILETLNIYRDGISFVHDQTIRYLNQGYSQDEIIKKIHATKPTELFKNPYLLEYYGTIEWSVRAIYMKNMGWFSGQIADLFPCSKEMRINGLAQLMNFKSDNVNAMDKLIDYLKYANKKRSKDDDETNRWLLELTTEIMIKLQTEMDTAKDRARGRTEALTEVQEIRYAVIRDMASYQTSAPARNYLLSYWLEEKYDIENRGGGNFSDIIMGRPMRWSMKTLPFHVDPVRCRVVLDEDEMITGVIELGDVGEIYKFRLKRVGVMQLTMIGKDEYDEADGDIDWVLRTSDKALKYILTDGGDQDDNKGKEKVKSGHFIPRIRTGAGALIAVLFGMVSGGDAEKNGLIKGKEKAVQFFKCLEFKTIAKL